MRTRKGGRGTERKGRQKRKGLEELIGRGKGVKGRGGGRGVREDLPVEEKYAQ